MGSRGGDRTSEEVERCEGGWDQAGSHFRPEVNTANRPSPNLPCSDRPPLSLDHRWNRIDFPGRQLSPPLSLTEVCISRVVHGSSELYFNLLVRRWSLTDRMW